MWKPKNSLKCLTMKKHILFMDISVLILLLMFILLYFFRSCPEASSVFNFHFLSWWAEEILHHQGKIYKKKKNRSKHMYHNFHRCFLKSLLFIIFSLKALMHTACVWQPCCLKATERRSCSTRSKFMTSLQSLGDSSFVFLFFSPI